MMLLCAGCAFRSYEGRARVHAEVLVAMARKGTDLLGSGRFTAESLPELTYPLERATAFVAEVRPHDGAASPRSLVALETLLARYRTFLDTLDRVRRDQRGAAARRSLEPALGDVETAGAAVLRALAEDGSG